MSTPNDSLATTRQHLSEQAKDIRARIEILYQQLANETRALKAMEAALKQLNKAEVPAPGEGRKP